MNICNLLLKIFPQLNKHSEDCYKLNKIDLMVLRCSIKKTCCDMKRPFITLSTLNADLYLKECLQKQLLHSKA